MHRSTFKNQGGFFPSNGSPARCPEVWGGFECSIIRINGDYRDQLIETGCGGLPADMNLAADLGIRALRYPLLWESVAHANSAREGWRVHDKNLETLRRRNVRPIAGLLHHGSGPRSTDFRDPAFPQRLADFACEAAARYPHIKDWTPINEPLTTARFSGLYGHWHPHDCATEPFLRYFFIQCEAIAAAMRAIRSQRPDARLIQTEDLGRVFSTPELAYQSDYENERRWLTFDALCGRIVPGHRFYTDLLNAGITAKRLDALSANACPPNILGLDHYLTSDRFLDNNISGVDEGCIGGNGRHLYRDAAAARMVCESQRGHLVRMKEAWERYGLPLALTEVHNGCTREEQVRWLVQAWNDSCAAARLGIDVRAVTVWALAGATDWNSLLTRRSGFYEAGAFDTRSGTPRLTLLARATRALAAKGTFDHPVLDGNGWWKTLGKLPMAARRCVAIQGRPIAGLLDELRRRDLAFVELQGCRTTVKLWCSIDCAQDKNGCQILAFQNHHPAGPEGRTPVLCVAANSGTPEYLLATIALDLMLDGETGFARILDARSPQDFKLAWTVDPAVSARAPNPESSRVHAAVLR